MSSATSEAAKLLAVSDLHMGYADNRQIVDRLRPTTDQDWLLVAGDVGEVAEQIEQHPGGAAQPVRHRRLGAGQPRAVVAPSPTR